MRIYEQGFVVVVSLPPETEVLDALKHLMLVRTWPSAAVWGIGALHDIQIGYFDKEARIYHKLQLEGDWELAACHGTISTKERDPFPHIHVVLSNIHGETRGGHLFRGKISAAGEFVVLPLPSTLPRKLDERTGLPLI